MYLKIKELNCFWYFKDYLKAFRWKRISTVFSLNTYLFFIVNTELLNSPQYIDIDKAGYFHVFLRSCHGTIFEL